MIRFVTATGPGCGKTVAAAALAWDGLEFRRKVSYFNPVQTGRRSGDLGDADFVAATTGIRAGEGLRYEEAIAPALAAEFSRVPVAVDAIVDMVRGEHYGTDLLIVEGNGGLLTPLSGDLTSGELARHLSAELVIATLVREGAINHTALTVDAARARSLHLAGIVVCGWPEVPTAIDRLTLERLSRLAPILGVIPLHPRPRHRGTTTSGRSHRAGAGGYRARLTARVTSAMPG